MNRRSAECLAIAAAVALVAVMLLGRLDRPLLWADEAETAMFAEHTRLYGYPRVHGERNVVYQFGPNIALGVKEGPDAYIGTTWGHFYFALPGLLWARSTQDLYTKTWRLRLPFALAGAAGLALWMLALAPALDEPGRRRRFAALFFLLCAVSVSLLLHLREVRYYALVVLLVGGIAHLHLGRVVTGTVGPRRHAIGLTLLLWLLFNTFFQAFFAVAALLALDTLWRVRAGRAGWRELAPLVAAGVLVLPLVIFFETWTTARAFAEGFSFSVAGYARNVATIALHLLRHEFLAPALACRIAVLVRRAGDARLRGVSDRLAVFVLGYALLGCLNPLALERYFVVLSPALTGLMLLDAFALVESAGAGAAPDARRRLRRRLAGGLALAVLILRLPAAPVLAGRLQELATPYRGPLDFVIPDLRERFPDPASLVVATNYEEYAFMYYLGSHTIVGLSLNNLVEDRALEPDVVVPRRRWPRSLRELRRFLARGEFEAVRYPVRDLHHNNVPALSRSRFMPDPHRFETAATDDPGEQLVIYLRSGPGTRTDAAEP